jgi:hypothetical protein
LEVLESQGCHFSPPEATTDEKREQASSAVEKAFSLDKQNGDAHAAHSFVLIQRDWNWPEGEAEDQRAIAIDPSNSFIYRWHSVILLQKGQSRRAQAGPACRQTGSCVLFYSKNLR